MILRIRDAVLTDEAAELVFKRKYEMEKTGKRCPMQRGVVVNILLKEYAEILKKNEKNNS